MKRKIRLSAILTVAVLMLALMIGSLYAWFSDDETGTGNSFTAGTLNLVSVISDNQASGPSGTIESVLNEEGDAVGANDNVSFSNIYPGSSGNVTWTLTNTGSVDGNLTIGSITVTDDENGLIEPEESDGDTLAAGELSSNMDVTLQRSIDGAAFTDQYTGTLNGLTVFTETAALNPGAHSIVYRLVWSVDGSVDNVIQSDSALLNIQFTLDQDQV